MRNTIVDPNKPYQNLWQVVKSFEDDFTTSLKANFLYCYPCYSESLTYGEQEIFMITFGLQVPRFEELPAAYEIILKDIKELNVNLESYEKIILWIRDPFKIYYNSVECFWYIKIRCNITTNIPASYANQLIEESKAKKE